MASNLVTAKLRPEDVKPDPFPHAVIPDAIDADLYATLAREMPPLEVLVKGRRYVSNERWNFSAANVGMSPHASPAWKAFIQAHVNQPFLDSVLTLFAPHIRAAYPNFESDFRPLPSLRAGIRGADDYSSANVLLDAQIAVNTPVTGPANTVRGPHVDMPEKLFIGLFYMRRDGDDSTGGELEFYRSRVKTPSFNERRDVPLAEMELVRRIPYAANQLVIFLNTPWTLHGVTPRNPTPHPRYFVNLVGQMGGPLFQARPPGLPKALMRRLGLAA